MTTTTTEKSNRIQATAERLLDGEVIACQSSLVDTLLADGRLDGWQWDEVENLWHPYAEDLDAPEPQDVYEWWLVTRWLADELRDSGEPVLGNGFGYWWGRTCTGQAILLDGTLQVIAERVIERMDD